MEQDDNITRSFHRASDLVKQWGAAALPWGPTVREALTIDRISFWDTIAPMLAFVHISKKVSRPSSPSSRLDPLFVIAKKTKRIGVEAFAALGANSNGCSAWPLNRSFLFLGFSPYIYREVLQPVAERIAKCTDLSAVVLDDSISWRNGNTTGVKNLTLTNIWQHRDSLVSRKTKRMRRELRVVAQRIIGASGLPAIIEASGLPWQQVRGVFAWLFGVSMPRLVSHAATALHIIEQHDPVLILSPDVNDPRNRVFSLAGKLAGIGTLELQFGFYGRNDIEWRFFLADHLAVTGEKNLSVMVEHGIPLERMTVTGSPRYDALAAKKSRQEWSPRPNPRMTQGSVVVLFASQPYYFGSFSSATARREMVSALFSEVARCRKIFLVVKPHPLEDPRELKNVASAVSNIHIADRQQDIRELLGEVDAFVTFFSSTTFDALVRNMPTLNLAFPLACANTLFEECGATFVARNTEDIADYLQSLTNGEVAKKMIALAGARERFLSEWFYRLDGNAAARVEAIALSMANRRRVDERTQKAMPA